MVILIVAFTFYYYLRRFGMIAVTALLPMYCVYGICVRGKVEGMFTPDRIIAAWVVQESTWSDYLEALWGPEAKYNGSSLLVACFCCRRKKYESLAYNEFESPPVIVVSKDGLYAPGLGFIPLPAFGFDVRRVASVPSENLDAVTFMLVEYIYRTSKGARRSRWLLPFPTNFTAAQRDEVMKQFMIVVEGKDNAEAVFSTLEGVRTVLDLLV